MVFSFNIYSWLVIIIMALKQIDFLLSNPTGYSVNILKLDPLYDPLRNLPGYKRIVDKYSSVTLD